MSDAQLDHERIRLELRRMERSQAWLGRQVGVKDSSLFNHYLRGRRRWPVGLDQRIAAVLGVPLQDLAVENQAA